MSTLEKLQAEFPHGSRWRTPVGEVRVVGHDPGHRFPIIVRTNGRPLTDGYMLDYARSWTRIPDLVPCPITEPVTLWPYDWSGTVTWGTGGPFGSDGGRPAIKLAPDGNGGIHATWEGGPE